MRTVTNPSHLTYTLLFIESTVYKLVNDLSIFRTAIFVRPVFSFRTRGTLSFSRVVGIIHRLILVLGLFGYSILCFGLTTYVIRTDLCILMSFPVVFLIVLSSDNPRLVFTNQHLANACFRSTCSNKRPAFLLFKGGRHVLRLTLAPVHLG